MKKLISVLLVTVLLLCGCNGGKNGNENGGIDIYNYIATLDNLEEYIILGDYKDISIDKIDVTPSSIAAYKAQLQGKYSYYERLDKKIVEKGDNVHVSFISYLNGVEFDGGSGQDDFIVGNGDFVFPELEASLVGMAVGNAAILDVTVPNDYFSVSLRGKTIRMKITVTQIQKKEKTLPEITDEFVKKNFGLASADEFESYVENKVAKEAEDEMMTQAWKAALANCEIIRYPDGIVEK